MVKPGLALAAAIAAIAGVWGIADALPGGAYPPDASTLWTGAVALGPCTRAPRRFPLSATPREREPMRRRRGELVGEILGAPPQSALILAKARSCAADAARTAPAVLMADAEGWTRFHAAFDSCLARTDAAPYLGSMSLRVVERCDW